MPQRLPPLSEARQVALARELLSHIKSLRVYKRGLSTSMICLIVSVVACVVVCVTSKNKHHAAYIETSNLRVKYTCLQDLNKRLTSDVERLTSDLEHVQTTNNSSIGSTQQNTVNYVTNHIKNVAVHKIDYNTLNQLSLETCIEDEDHARRGKHELLTHRDSVHNKAWHYDNARFDPLQLSTQTMRVNEM